MGTLIYIELIKIYKKWRTYIGFIAIGVIIPIVQFALYSTQENYIKMLTRGLQDSFIFIGTLFNGYLIAYLILASLFIHIPFLIVLVGGDELAGEATAGTYRILLTRPVSRFEIVFSKYIAGIIYVITLIAWLAFLSLGVSILLFGRGELIAFRGKLIIFTPDDVLWRFIYAYLYAILSMTTVFSLSFFFSSFVENAIGPIIASMAVMIILLVLSALPKEFFENIQPYFFTTHMTKWENFFDENVNFKEILNSAFVLVVYSSVFFILTTINFVRKDILS